MLLAAFYENLSPAAIDWAIRIICIGLVGVLGFRPAKAMLGTVISKFRSSAPAPTAGTPLQPAAPTDGGITATEASLCQLSRVIREVTDEAEQTQYLDHWKGMAELLIIKPAADKQTTTITPVA